MMGLRLAETKRLWFFAALAVVIVGATVAVFGAGTEDGSAALRDELEAEFDGAYPAEAAGGGDTLDIELIAAQAAVEIIDGTATDVWTYNGTVPGPAIRANLGDTLRINVRNELPAATTIHWHGIRVPNDMDGVPDINQPRIEPGDTFVYEFTPPDAGTYWYHSHTNGSEQLERGLYGSLVIDDPDLATDYAADAVWVIDDWLLNDDGQIAPDFNTSADRTHNGRWGDLITVNASLDETVMAKPGERIRLRLVNASNGRVYTPDFSDLDATVVAIDGLLVGTPVETSDLKLAPGNRADIDIIVPDAPGAYMINDMFIGTPQPLASIIVANEPGIASNFDPPSNPAVPDWASAIDAPVDHELVFETNNDTGEWEWTINGAAFPDYESVDVTEGEFTKIRLVNRTHPLHPIHLHGQFFKVLSRNGEPVDEPFFRDTVLLEMLDEVEIGLVPLDVGTWVLHCHIQEHAEAGMMTVMNVNPAS